MAWRCCPAVFTRKLGILVMNRAKYWLAAALALSLSSLSAAQTFFGTTAGAPIWNRPTEGAPPISLSGVGTEVPYQATLVSVSANGSYTFNMNSTTGWDSYAFLYADPFNAASPLANVLIGDDNNGSPSNEQFTINLTTGIQYVFVGTGYGNADFGAYRLDVTSQAGTATFAPVPEPASMTALAIGGLALLRRRRATK